MQPNFAPKKHNVVPLLDFCLNGLLHKENMDTQPCFSK